MARRRDNTFLLVAAGLAFVAWRLFKPKAAAGPATHQSGTAGGGIAGSPNQVILGQPVTAWMSPTGQVLI